MLHERRKPRAVAKSISLLWSWSLVALNLCSTRSHNIVIITVSSLNLTFIVYIFTYWKCLYFLLIYPDIYDFWSLKKKISLSCPHYRWCNISSSLLLGNAIDIIERVTVFRCALLLGSILSLITSLDFLRAARFLFSVLHPFITFDHWQYNAVFKFYRVHRSILPNF